MPIPLVEPSEREAIRIIKRRIQGISEVAHCSDVTMSFTRKKPNIHMHVELKGNPGYQETHRICSEIENEVRRLVANARVVIHSQPGGARDGEESWKIVKKMAEAEPGSRGVQNIHVRNRDGKLGVDFHLQVGSALTTEQANELGARLETSLKTASPSISEVVIHRATISDLVSSELSGLGTEVMWYLEHVVKAFPELRQLHLPMVRRIGDKMKVALRVAFVGITEPATASKVAERLGSTVKSGYPTIGWVDVIQEKFGLGET